MLHKVQFDKVTMLLQNELTYNHTGDCKCFIFNEINYSPLFFEPAHFSLSMSLMYVNQSAHIKIGPPGSD
jgi:hypothetical protein